MRGLAAIFFTVLKWIFLLLLILIGVILALLACILFVPVRYHICIEKQGKFVVRGYAGWLLHVFHLSFWVEDGEERHVPRLFGIPLRGRNKKTKPENKKAEKRNSGRTKTDDQGTGERRHPEGKSPDDRAVNPESAGEGRMDHHRKQYPVRQRKAGRRFFSWWNEFFLRIRRILGKIKKGFGILWKLLTEGPDQESRSRAAKVMTVLSDDNTLQLWRMVWSGLSSLWRHSRPKKLTGWVHFGTSDPCTTGEILGVIGAGYALIGDGVRIVPDFERAVLEGMVEMKGRIRMIRLLSVLGRVFFSRQWKRFKSQIG